MDNVKNIGTVAASVSFSVMTEYQLAKNKANLTHLTGWVEAFQIYKDSI